jgi:hypothetical protein
VRERREMSYGDSVERKYNPEEATSRKEVGNDD